jgi:RNA-directed DNA polymerase
MSVEPRDAGRWMRDEHIGRNKPLRKCLQLGLNKREKPGRSGAGWNVRYGQTVCWRPSKGGERRRWFSLIDKVIRPVRLFAAWKLAVKANKGSAGSDHQSIEDFRVRDLAGNLHQLEKSFAVVSYRPRPIRRVYIDKPGSKEKRPLGIPTVRDRVVQGALRLVIEPIFEREFVPRSYGFRPGRGCKDALREVDTT